MASFSIYHSEALVHGLFLSPKNQIERICDLGSERGWDIPDVWMYEAERSIPEWPEDKLVAVTLVPYLTQKDGMGGLERTFQELWGVAANEQRMNRRWKGYDKADLNCLRTLERTYKPSLRWETIDLGSRLYESPEDTPLHLKKSPHAGILASAALHPDWVRAMDGKNVPHVWLPGYKVKAEVDSWSFAPYLDFIDGRITLDYDWIGDRDPYYVVPSFVRE